MAGGAKREEMMRKDILFFVQAVRDSLRAARIILLCNLQLQAGWAYGDAMGSYPKDPSIENHFGEGLARKRFDFGVLQGQKCMFELFLLSWKFWGGRKPDLTSPSPGHAPEKWQKY